MKIDKFRSKYITKQLKKVIKSIEKEFPNHKDQINEIGVVVMNNMLKEGKNVKSVEKTKHDEEFNERTLVLLQQYLEKMRTMFPKK